MFTWKYEAERVQAQADAEYALLLHPGTLRVAWRFQTTGRKLARYLGEGKRHLFTVNHPRTVERVPYDPSGPSSR
ncbi:hypothetical protein VTO73DRAFT_1585 [Trametes versicolor]